MIGSTFAHFRVTAKLGEGGMGEVYRATDSKLKRDVAIKILPAAFTADHERLARFEREAQLLAQLQHPNIASIYGIEEVEGTRALVMELVEGPTLAERLEHGSLPFDESLSIALQIAQALEEAHEKGIVHRDLKPQNIKAPIEGKVKVLDFGLAKAMDPMGGASGSGAGSASQLAQSPTLTMGATMQGMILGTAAYMSPEQARGVAVDKRADIWAFGVVLYEMLTGSALFRSDTVTDTLAGVLRGEIDFARLSASTPPAVRRLLQRCLERDAKRRLRDIGEARLVLESTLHGEAADADRSIAPANAARPSWLGVLPWLLVAAVAAGWAWSALRGTPGATSPSSTRASVLAVRLPTELELPLDERGIYGQTGILAISPDGGTLAFVVGVQGRGLLYVRELENAAPRVLEGTTGASSPFFSPDGRWIGYFASGKLRKVPVAGGRSIDLADSSLDRGAVWCADGSIVFAPNAVAGLFRLPAGGGAAVELTKTEASKGERTHRWPAELPGGREVAFTVGSVGQPGNYEDSSIDAVDLATGARRTLFRRASQVRFTTSGFALLGRAGEVLAMPLAGAAGRATDEALPVVRNVAGVAASGVVHFDVALDGTLVYAERDPAAAKLGLAWYSPDGTVESLDLPEQQYSLVRISPDGRRAALAVGPGGGRGGDIWVLDFASGAVSKFTFDGVSFNSTWSRDGKSIVYVAMLPDGSEEFRQRPADGSVGAVTVKRFPDGRAREPVGFAVDGSLVFWEDAGAGEGGNILYLPAGGGEERPLVSSPAIEIQATVSSDGRWIAYAMDRGGEPEIYVQPFPPTGAKWQVATNGSLPLWSRDGSELFFIMGRDLMSVPVSTASGFSFGNPRRLFEMPITAAVSTDTSTGYDVAADGRFLGVRSGSTESMTGHLVLIPNWTETLRRTGIGGAKP